MTMMSNVDLIRSKYTVDQIKVLIYSMTDAIYDILFNNGETGATKHEADDIENSLINGGRLSSDAINAIFKEMLRDINLSFTDNDRQFYDFIRTFINSYYLLSFIAIKHYTGSLTKGRLHPDTVGTNGCKAAYLFVHERHPKYKLNKSMKSEVGLIIDDIFGKKKNLGD